jgi:hypothetical protein
VGGKCIINVQNSIYRTQRSFWESKVVIGILTPESQYFDIILGFPTCGFGGEKDKMAENRPGMDSNAPGPEETHTHTHTHTHTIIFKKVLKSQKLRIADVTLFLSTNKNPFQVLSRVQKIFLVSSLSSHRLPLFVCSLLF